MTEPAPARGVDPTSALHKADAPTGRLAPNSDLLWVTTKRHDLRRPSIKPRAFSVIEKESNSRAPEPTAERSSDQLYHAPFMS